MSRFFAYLLFPFINLLFSLTIYAQQSTLSGKVTDKADNSELIGVTIIVKGTKYGAVTDESGKYQIGLPPGTYNLEGSYIGYEKLLFTGIVVKEGESKTLNFAMNPTAVTIDQ